MVTAHSSSLGWTLLSWSGRERWEMLKRRRNDEREGGDSRGTRRTTAVHPPASSRPSRSNGEANRSNKVTAGSANRGVNKHGGAHFQCERTLTRAKRSLSQTHRMPAEETACVIYSHHISKVVCWCHHNPARPPSRTRDPTSLTLFPRTTVWYFSTQRVARDLLSYYCGWALQPHIYWSIISSIIPLPYLGLRQSERGEDCVCGPHLVN